jgi:hypothetical protein
MKDISKLNWIKAISPNEYDMFLDHHMLASFRMCQGYFELLHMEGRRPKNGYSWSLEFGTLFHRIIEEIYNWRQDNEYSHDRLIQKGIELWDNANMDRFREHPTYKSLGGKPGFITLCIQYVSYYNNDTERLRIVGVEIGFGRGKDVPLGVLYLTGIHGKVVKINCFLAGRIDFLAEDGRKIGPIDHKTRALFGKKDLSTQYSPHEGMTGYIYAARELIKNLPEMSHLQANTAWMNFVQVQNEADMSKRFRRIIVMRTPEQLEEYRQRQLETFKDIFFYLQWDRTAQWNTEVCTHWYGTTCIYQHVHRLPTKQDQLIVLGNDFTDGEFWNPEVEGDSNGDTPVSRNKPDDKAAVQESSV